MRRRVTTVLRWAFVVGVIGVITWQVVRQREAALDAVLTIGPAGVVGSISATLVGLGATGMAWRTLLAGLGHRLRVPDAAGVFFVAQLGKYLPGSVWPYVAQARMLRHHGVPGGSSAAAGLFFVLLHCATGGVLAAVLLPALGDPTISRRFGWLPWVLPLFLVVLHPGLVHRVSTALHRKLGRGSGPARVPLSSVLRAVAWLSVAWAGYGVALFALVAPLGDGDPRTLLLATGGFALAWTVGFIAAAVLVVAAPAGLGVRELALFSVLAPVLPVGSATAVVVLSRLGQLLGDVVWAASSWAVARRRLDSGRASGHGGNVPGARILAEVGPEEDRPGPVLPARSVRGPR